ncbi:hypothetical protein BZL30_5723 [Mycobacterium kansasii]|uniref:Uncharacterized protein n=1 Tax=Mycobacterium kansasii TaxID=1768 RepID=A0A1V3WZX7_MYCKA|nr:hypothetical protein BZL30_5723 [Mycobacterium kansasii]
MCGGSATATTGTVVFSPRRLVRTAASIASLANRSAYAFRDRGTHP